jgi:hypothetical protein
MRVDIKYELDAEVPLLSEYLNEAIRVDTVLDA